MIELSDKLNYAEWDSAEFIIPQELILKDDSFLYEAIYVFYAAGGYDFFKVVNPSKYATRWLDFVGQLYSEIMDGKYEQTNNKHKNPLSDIERKSLKEQGVPDLFTNEMI